ncbi:uncharacterized protein DNG_04305 [Cephalotrichum gorgonifer]|uniref:LysM domain-containing protein n=1 Tax=Cephalotrichum gorgonifer TaxID=2041049 RepID=A0AAE8MYM1_9PEZI|nr:uncharacterized protein DNG_04305 [Cephalotrichum gorgonifer]
MHFTCLHLFVTGLLSRPGLVSAGTVRHSLRGVECYFDLPVASGDTCETLASTWGISVELFITINPGVTCSNLEADRSYCVIGEWTPAGTSTLTPSQPQSTTTRTSTTTRSSTARSTTFTPSTSQSSTTWPSATPITSPTMPGIAEKCDRFYMIKSGDQCDTVAWANNITVAQLRSWNSEINAACSNLWLDYYVCTHVSGALLPSATTSAPTPNYTPTMPGIAPTCDRFYMVKSGDQCDTIASSNAITVAQLRAWNTEINAACSNLWLDYYICTHIPGAMLLSTTFTVPTPSNSSDLPGTATPMPGIVANCSRYYLVVSGDGCDSIAAKNGITVANFRRWNTFIDAACTNLWADALVCTNAP